MEVDKPILTIKMSTSRVIQVGNLYRKSKFCNPQRGRIYSTDGISPCINEVGGGGNLEPKILVYETRTNNR